MKAFVVGLLVLILAAVLATAGIFLLPIFLLLGIFVRILVAIFVLLFVVWVVGKLTLFVIGAFREPKA